MASAGLRDLLRACASTEAAIPVPATKSASPFKVVPITGIAKDRITFDYAKLSTYTSSYKRKSILAHLSIKNGDTFDTYCKRYSDHLASDDNLDPKREQDLTNAWNFASSQTQAIAIGGSKGDYTFNLERFHHFNKAIKQSGLINGQRSEEVKLRGRIGAFN